MTEDPRQKHLLWHLVDRFERHDRTLDADDQYVKWADVEAALTDSARHLAQVTRERDALKANADRCSEHPNEPFELVCVECFESERTAAATERAEHAEAECDAALRQGAALRAAVEQFIERCQDIRDGSPNAFYAHVDAFCKSALLTAPPQTEP